MILKDGTVFACGDNHYGQLGLGDFINDPSKGPSKPYLRSQTTRPRSRLLLALSTIILAEDGTVFACGRNLEGQLGLGDLEKGTPSLQ